MTPLYRQPYRPVASRTPRSIAALRSTVPVASKNSKIGIPPVVNGLKLSYLISEFAANKNSHNIQFYETKLVITLTKSPLQLTT